MAELATREALGAVASEVSTALTLEAHLIACFSTVLRKVATVAASIALLLWPFILRFRALVRNVPQLATHETLSRAVTGRTSALGTIATDVATLVADITCAVVFGAFSGYVARFGAIITCPSRSATP